MNNLHRALLAGAAGACAVTLVNQAARHSIPNAPRLDIMGMRAIAKGARLIGSEPPQHLERAALAGDLASNTAYYSLVGAVDPSKAIGMGAILGLAAGIGAVLLPAPMGLGEGPTERSPATAGMSMGWYLIGGLVSGLIYRSIAQD